jgi:mannosyltransferase OCH1-like enzyme
MVVNLVVTEKNIKPTLCLNMIVKNESHIIETTLKMLCSKIDIDYWVISDTGSTDNTQQIIKNFFLEKNIPGELYENNWVNFAHNRTLALEYAYNKSDLLFIFDADDSIEGNIILPTENLADGYKLEFSSGSMKYSRILLINNRKKWVFKSVIHEYIECLEPNVNIKDLLGNYHLISGRSGSRNKDPQKYLKDALLLSDAYTESKNTNDGLHSRYSFYCANSYKDAGKYDEAIEWYKNTLTLDNWSQEKYICCYRLFQCYSAINKIETGMYYLNESFKYDNERVECLFHLVKHYLNSDNILLAFLLYLNCAEKYEKKYINIDVSNKLFIEIDIGDILLPFYVILVADKITNINNVHNEVKIIAKKTIYNMFQIIFTKKYINIEKSYIGNTLYNFQFFIDYCVTENKSILTLFQEYINFLEKNNFDMSNYDFMKKYIVYGIKCKCNEEEKLNYEDCIHSKNILIYTGYSNLPWNLTYYTNNALGGSETAVIELAKQFPKYLNIYIFGDVQEEIVDNIHFVSLNNANKLFSTTLFHTAIISRYISFYDIYSKAQFYQSYIWGHDIKLFNYGSNLTENQILEKYKNKITGCVCQTEWHKNLFISNYPVLNNKSYIINNGINYTKISNIQKNTEKIQNRFIYTSCVERGLKRLLDLWPSITQELDNCELLICTYNDFPRNNDEIEMLNIIKSHKNIKFLGKKTKDELYELMCTSEYWLYPSYFPETSCITAMEMLASQVICLYYSVAGLEFTIGNYGIVVSEEKRNEIDSIMELSYKKKKEIKQKGKEYASMCSWENRKNSWIDLLKISNNSDVTLERTDTSVESNESNVEYNNEETIESSNESNVEYNNEETIESSNESNVEYNNEETIESSNESNIEKNNFYKFLINKKSILKNNDTQKKIAIYNGFPFHYELFGYIIDYCNKYNHHLSIFTNMTDTIGFFEFYKKMNLGHNVIIFDHKFYETAKNDFDYTFLITDNDNNFKEDWINSKVISICHHYTKRRNCLYNISTRDFSHLTSIEHNWAIPCFIHTKLSDKNKKYCDDEIIDIVCVGGYSYNTNTLNRLPNNKTINLHVISRSINKMSLNSLNNNINLIVYEKISAIQMYEIVKNSHFVFVDNTENIDHITGKSMSGSIPISFSCLTPLIISKQNNELYKFKNVIEFELNKNDNIELKNIDYDLLNNEREEMILQFENIVDSYIESKTIPKTIVQTWETKYIEKNFLEIINKWKILNNNYKYLFFDENDREQFIKKYFNENVHKAYLKIIPGAYKADLFRYCYLYKNGGVYADIDTLPMNSLDDVVIDNIELIATIDFNDNPNESHHNIANGFIAVRPNHPIMFKCIEQIVYNCENNCIPKSKLDFSGPGLLGQCINMYLNNPKFSSFIGKEGIYSNKIHFLKFEKNTEFMINTLNNKIILQNKNGNTQIQELYNIECNKIKNFVSWVQIDNNSILRLDPLDNNTKNPNNKNTFYNITLDPKRLEFENISTINNIENKYKYNLSVCVCIKNEIHHIDKFLEHYISEGVEHFYIVDNNSNDNIELYLKHHKYNNYISLFSLINLATNVENNCYKDLLNQKLHEIIRHETKWAILVSCDEFMFGKNGFKISTYIDTIPKDIGCVYVNWTIINPDIMKNADGITVANNFIIHDKKSRINYDTYFKNNEFIQLTNSLGRSLFRTSMLTDKNLNIYKVYTNGKIITNYGIHTDYSNNYSNNPYSEDNFKKINISLNKYSLRNKNVDSIIDFDNRTIFTKCIFSMLSLDNNMLIFDNGKMNTI